MGRYFLSTYADSFPIAFPSIFKLKLKPAKGHSFNQFHLLIIIKGCNYISIIAVGVVYVYLTIRFIGIQYLSHIYFDDLNF